MDIAPIQTRYKGYRFRSRAEAKWAIFFDELGIEYEYELEGFVLGDGTLYLPDFYLSQVNMWAEVKGTSFTDDERDKCRQLAIGTDKPVLMLDGPPTWKNYDAYQLDTWSDEILIYDYSLVPFYLDDGRFPCVNFIPDGNKWMYGTRYINAVEAARSARFEHGETP